MEIPAVQHPSVRFRNGFEICSGQLVYEDTVVTDAFNPARIDVSGLAPGVYTVKVTIDGKQTIRTVVKL